MKKISEKEEFEAYVMGNYALARAMAEVQVRVITSYPGSPTPEIAEALSEFKSENFYFEFSANEKVALEKAAGASLNGHLSCCFFKSVGLNVASDSLIQLPMMELIGGLVVILGDDPGANSSQNEQDNRHFSRMAYLPMLEPSSPKEAYEMFKTACSLSVKLRMPIFLRITTHIAHSREKIKFSKLIDDKYSWESKFSSNNGPYVPVASAVFPLKERALNKLNEFKKEISSLEINKIFKNGENNGKLIIASGLTFAAAYEAVKSSEVKIDILKIGASYPLDEYNIADIIRGYEEVFVLEELDRILEGEIKSLCFDRKINAKIYSRKNISDLMGEIGVKRAKKIFSDFWPEFSLPKENIIDKKGFPRFPQLCPGCGHRSAFYAVKEFISQEDITVADIGCHTLGYLAPYKMGEVLFSMGHSVSTAAGLALKNEKRKVLAFMGDSTFFHAGLPGLLNASVLNSEIILILLENGTTAMTGHQSRLGSGEIGESLDLIKLLEACGVKFIRKADAYNRTELKKHLSEAKNHKGFAVIIAHHPCMLKYSREMKKKNPSYKPGKVEIDKSICDLRKTCLEKFACPSFALQEDGTVKVNEDLCIGDGSCIMSCPSKAIKPKKEAK